MRDLATPRQPCDNTHMSSRISDSAYSMHALLATWRSFAENGTHPLPPAFAFDDVQITRLIEDSRVVQPGDCFIARMRAGYSDGHRFIPQAIAAGATLVIAQDGISIPDLPDDAPPIWLVPDTAIVLSWLAGAMYDFPGQHMTIIGITGTDGKTSITNILYDVLQAAELKSGMISTIKAVIGDREEPTGLHVSTPQAPEVQPLLRRMVDDGCTHCILESTSYGLLEHRADSALYDVAIISNVTHEHLDYHKTWDNYMAAKGRLFELARGFGIANMDDASFEPVLNVSSIPIFSYGFEDGADVRASDVVFSAENTTFTTTLTSGKQLTIHSPLVGKFNIYNMLAAIAAAEQLGISAEAIKQGIESVEIISGRMERISEGQPFLTIVDFAHTPNALAKAVEAARGMTYGRIITVFGSAGRRDVEKRRMMAEISQQHADLTILTAEDPRQEPLDQILQMMADGCLKHGGVEGETFWRIADRGRAIYHALTLATSDDLVLVCGKGHEQSMAFGNEELPWDDRAATRAAIAAFLKNEPMPDLGLPTY